MMTITKSGIYGKILAFSGENFDFKVVLVAYNK